MKRSRVRFGRLPASALAAIAAVCTGVPIGAEPAGPEDAATAREAKKQADVEVRSALDAFRVSWRQAKDEGARADAVRGLGACERKDVRILSALVPLLSTDGDPVRIEAADGVGTFKGERRAVQALLAAVTPNKKKPAVLEAIFRALASLGDRSAVPTLAGFLDDRRGRVAAAAARAMGDLGGPGTAESLRRELDRLERTGRIPAGDGRRDDPAMDAARREAGERYELVAPALREAIARAGGN